MNENSIINLQPVFITKEEDGIPVLNSFFLYIFLFFQFIVIGVLLYYFFKTEIIFLYYKIFINEPYSDQDKKIYNNYMNALRKIIVSETTCVKEGSFWYPKYNKTNYMLTLDGNKINFSEENSCKSFLNKN